jgi:arylsulfatase A-like enzyme
MSSACFFQTATWPRLYAACLALVLSLAACSAPARPNILVIVIDSLRTDRVGFYDTHGDLTPFLDSLAEHGNVFWNAYAQSSWSSPSMASLWTSRYPSQHGVNAFTSVLPDTGPTLVTILKQHGYVTGGFSANFLLSKHAGFAQGFDHYRTFATAPKPRNMYFNARAAAVNREALAWLDTLRGQGPTPQGPTPQGAAPVFLYLHYMEPHFPYWPPKDFFDRVLAQRPNALAERQILYDMIFANRNRWHQTDEATVAVLRDLYDATVLNIDAKLSDLFSQLKSRGFLDHSIVVITSDHGEAFLEHGSTSHGNTLYNEVIHVPLLLLVSGQSTRTDIRRPVSLVDLGPTLLDLVGISAPSSFEGGSLASAMGRARPPGFFEKLVGKRQRDVPPAYSELLQVPDQKPTIAAAPLRSVVVGTHKLIVHPDGTTEAYDLAADPGETNPSALTAPDRSALQETIARMREQTSRSAAPAPTAALDVNTTERLRLWKYIQ